MEQEQIKLALDLITLIFFSMLGQTYTRNEIMERDFELLKEQVQTDNETLHRRLTNTNDELKAVTQKLNDVKQDQEHNEGYIEAYLKYSKEK